MLAFAETVGRRIAVDFGFGALLDKIEEHFGKGVLKVFLVLIGLAVALFCGKMIWEIALGPLTTFLISTVANGQWIKALVQIFWMAIAVALGVGLASLISANLMSWRDYKRGKELLGQTKELHDVIKANIAEARSAITDSNEITQRARQVLMEATALREEAETIVTNAEASLAKRGKA